MPLFPAAGRVLGALGIRGPEFQREYPNHRPFLSLDGAKGPGGTSPEAPLVYLVVGLGGALGAMARHALNHLVHQRLLTSRFPWGIFGINVAGSFIIGLLAGWLASGRVHWSFPARTFVFVGLLGGFTTFSSFSFDTMALAREGLSRQAVANVLGQVLFSLIAVWAGYGLGLSK